MHLLDCQVIPLIPTLLEMDVLHVDEDLLETDVCADAELQWPSEMSDDSCAVMQDLHAFNDKQSCLFFNVFGTQDTWQGKRFSVVSKRSGKQGMLQLIQWPVQTVLVQLFRTGGVQSLYMIAMTCRCFRDAAQQLIEEHAREEYRRQFLDPRQLGKFVDSFGCFAWALNLRSFLPAGSLTHWYAEELDAAYNFLSAQVLIDERAPMHGLQPIAAKRWRTEGRLAFESFCADCLAPKCAFSRVLFHYQKAWKHVRSILETNAAIVRRLQFKGQSTSDSVSFNFPCVTFQVRCVVTSDTGVLDWTPNDVYHWFRIKKFPVSGLLRMELNGPSLVRLYSLAQKMSAAENIFLMPSPRGLGMATAQYTRLQWLMDKRLLVTPEAVSQHHQITYRVGELL